MKEDKPMFVGSYLLMVAALIIWRVYEGMESE